MAACAKHFVGDGGTTKGIDENNTVISMNGLLNIHMPAYYNAISKGVATVMVSYSSWNGKRMHINRDLVTGFLKNKMKFRVEQLLKCPFFSRDGSGHSRHNLFRYVFSGIRDIRLAGY